MFVIGKILKPHGVKGSVKVEIITSFPEHFLELNTVYIEHNNQKQAYSIEEARLSNRFVFLKLSGIDDYDRAASLRNHYIYIAQEDLKPLSENEYYIHDLIGLKVFDEQGAFIGTLRDVWTYSANDIYVLKTDDGAEHLIPAIQSVVKSVNLKERTMVIHVMEGMLD